MEITSLRDIVVRQCGSRYFTGHVTIQLAMCAFLLAFGYNHVSILNGYRDMKPERYLGHVLDLLWSRDVISHVPIRLLMWGFL